ncbi:MAG: DNA helicase UvrD [Candidatus Wildermuthbacteria bacterium RIFCSPLOWO2_02_FULL_47_9c]|uniref:UvrD/REP helicase n=2 Tax=Parcubacteria group TaxID=1794811 RepID=A0A837IN79_9BACT|nr:MAG: UvrD/REP helicase [Candidatus Yanofskybacteria bacterium GW2011_GWC1_48_11]KKW03965.1 MAG: UvrD/REP helicase [Parcubacteria group bacterium GW2011_GWB1_49_12]KKW08689.1 MAG: UvrD/REP helicase [Parcubacteria group bacterium GW2011_GWA1_49_26]KKW13906.1 MAG: UvrD/REP helicase [Parcubacteria group bacterium GW2011_GWA2_50_10]OHA61639.1 MAG: DNA helicase UvrD [Candidatus Wildermuthbacteria bacterium GWA1_49_26]OHA65357.1 MAG: DNA helicase UvrD [Candidatus Wildermuthbacteria bacterium RIFCS
MKFVGDFHIHSHFSRATSKELTIPNLDRWAAVKGITVMGTGDFTYPAWVQEMKQNLELAEEGLYKLKGKDTPTRFLLSSEISCIYSKGGAVRRIHLVVLAPSFEIVEKINAHLGVRGNLKSDGRPILGIDAKEIVKIALDASPECMVIPAHAWTPWFSVFGSKSGFNSLGECFDEYTKYIYAIETGLSSDPAMNWRLSALDSIALISNSDSHSLAKIGREANVFDTELSYAGIAEAIRAKDPKKFLFTVEFFPEEGKYHYDGHRLCGVSMQPEESKRHNNICPKCKRPLTIGVLNRVAELADRPAFDKSSAGKPGGAIPFKSLIPLEEIIADALGIGVISKRVRDEYEKLVGALGSEFEVLLNADQSSLQSATLPEIAEGIMRVREGRVHIEPGYDGEYGKIKIFQEGEQQALTTQKSLF